MSLLDDVSIVVTPNGYKAGELYAVVPVPTEGAEEVTNGDFDGGTTDWNLGNAVWQQGSGNGEVKLTKPSSGNAVIYQIGLSFAANTVLRYRFNIVDYSGLVSVRIDGYSGSNPLNTPLSFAASEGNVDVYVTTDRVGSSVFLYLTGGSTGDYVVLDNVSVRVWTGADMDVTRATAATRVDEDGLVNYAEIVSDTELVTNGDFATDSDWTKGTGWTISGGTASCDGSQSGNTDLSQNITTDTGKQYKITYTVSNYSAGSIFIRLNSGNITSTKSSNGTFTEILSGAGGTQVILRANLDFIGSVDNVSVKEVTRDNVPRIDYTGGGCPHILAEPMRTNYNPISEDIDIWSAVEVLREKNYTSPDGTLNAVKITDNSVNSTHRVLLGITTPSSGEFTYSVFLKKGTMTDAVLNVYSGGTVGIGTIDLENGTIIASGGGVNAKIEDYGNDWYRCSIGGTLANTSTTIYLYLSDSKNAYIGNGDFLYMAFAQFEEGSYPTSYIPTSGSTVTRNQDIFTRDGIGSLINDSEGVLFAEWKPKISSDYSFFSINNGTSNEIVTIGKSNNTTTMFVGVKTTSGYQLLYNSSSHDLTIFNKVAVKWKSGDMAVWVNGVEVLTGTSTNLPTGMNKLSFDFSGTNTFPFFGKVKQLQVYNTALTDEQLLQLTGESGTDFYESYAEMAAALTYTIQ